MEINGYAEIRQKPHFSAHLSQKYAMSNAPDIKYRFCIITSFKNSPERTTNSPSTHKGLKKQQVH